MSTIASDLAAYRRKVRDFIEKLDTVFEKYGHPDWKRWEEEDRKWFETQETYLEFLAEGVGLSKKGEDRVVNEVREEIQTERDKGS